MNLPVELTAVFRRYPDAKAKFDNYSPAHQKQYIDYVLDAKQAKTRINRADRVVMMLTDRRLTSVYSAKTIPDVFGLKPDMTTRVIGSPKNYGQIMDNWQFSHMVKNDKDKIDFAHLFVQNQSELISWLPKLKNQLQPSGMIWVSWLKKASGISTDVSDNVIRNFAIEIGLVDVKVCALSDIWSGLKLVIPRANRV